MSRPKTSLTTPSQAKCQSPVAVTASDATLALTPEQLAHWAHLVARAEAAFPLGLEQNQAGR